MPGHRHGAAGALASPVRDAKRWREITHTIKGAARGVGAFAMGEAAAAAGSQSDPTNTEKPGGVRAQTESRSCAVYQNYLAA